MEQARALAPEDYKVQTEWAYLVIKRAAQESAALDAPDRMEQAFLELEDAIARWGHQDSVVDSALEYHPNAGDLRQLSRDFEQEYLMVGAVEQR